jgi:hypothetical protein
VATNNPSSYQYLTVDGEDIVRVTLNRPEVRNEITPQRKVIYFNVIDERITEEFLAKLKTYCEAFFFGMKIEIIRPKKTFLELIKEYEIP